MGPSAAILPCGQRLHLQHGPIDLIIGADRQKGQAFGAAEARFATILAELSDELGELRAEMTPVSPPPQSPVAQRMHRTCQPFASETFLTRMAAVAGAVADEVLAAMTEACDLGRAYVNNGGDIALHLAPGSRFRTAMLDHTGRALGMIEINHADPVRGIATSGRHGRSHSLGIPDSVTVLAKNAARADVAATLIANAVDLPGHPRITRRPACDLKDDSDLGTRSVVTGCATLSTDERLRALSKGAARAEDYREKGRLIAASLHLQGDSQATNSAAALIKDLAHA